MTEQEWNAQLDKDYNYAKRHNFLFEALYKGKFLLIHNETFISSFDTWNAAADEGIRLYENKTPYTVYEVKDINREDVPTYVFEEVKGVPASKNYKMAIQ